MNLEVDGQKTRGGWAELWPQMMSANEGLLQEYPEVLAVLRRAVGEMIRSGAPVEVFRKRPGPTAPRGRFQKIGELLSCLNPIALFGSSKSGDQGRHRVLFVPLFDRNYCLDTCGLVASAMENVDPETEIHVVSPPVMRREKNMIPPKAIWRAQPEIASCTPMLSILSRALPAYRAFLRGVRSDSALLAQVEQVYPRWRLTFLARFLIHYRFVASAGTWLRRERISKLVSINDLVEVSAWLFGAAVFLKRETHLIMHGVPGRQNWPFLADKCWVWGQQSLQALQDFGAPASRLNVVGHLEIELLEESASYDGPESDRNTLLVFSQVRAGGGWKTDVFLRVFGVVCEAMDKAQGDWKLQIRIHPSDTATGIEAIKSTCIEHGVEYAIGDDTTLEEDLESCDFAVSVNSTALLSALLMGIPCAQYFPNDFRDLFGEPFLTEELIMKDAEDLATALDRPHEAYASSLEESRQEIFSNRGEVARVAAELLAGEKSK